MFVARVRHRAGEAPTAEELASLTVEALARPPAEMSAAQIRQLSQQALVQANQVSYLLGKLAGMLGEDDSPGGQASEPG